MSETVVDLLGDWRPRAYQRQLWDYLKNGGKRAIEIAHRRWGKDDVALHWAAWSMIDRVGVYWHMLPEAAQARKAIWEAVNPHTGRRRIDEAFPKELRETTRENEMFIRLVNGATWQVVGSDNFNSLVGSPPVGLVGSEWALANPAAWAYLRPILRENGGWALFITTPRGNNHARDLLEAAKANPEWFAEVSTWRESGVFTDEQMQAELAEYIAENGLDHGTALFKQEYECSFDAAVIGAFYLGEITNAFSEGRVTAVPYEPSLPVFTYWDLGLDDATAVWFAQFVGKEIRLIDHQEWTSTALTTVAGEVLKKPYSYGGHYMPHDVQAREMTSGRSREESLRAILGQITVVPMTEVADGIAAVRSLFPRMWFDATKTTLGLEALRNYRKKWDEKKKVFDDHPLHDWASHTSDAMRYLAVSYQERIGDPRRVQSTARRRPRSSPWAT